MQKIKSFICRLLVVLVIFLGFGIVGGIEDVYSRDCCRVFEIQDDVAIVEDLDENLWEVKSKGLHEGDYVRLIMMMNHTAYTIDDDYVTMVIKNK